MSKGIEIAGKTVLVTGANRGIGKAIIAAMVSGGATKVYAAVRTLSTATPLVEEYGDAVVPIRIDVSEPETIVAAAAAATDVDIVINNAGVLKKATPLAEDAIEQLNFEMKVNVHGLLNMARAFAPVLQTNGGGAFVQLNSVASLKCFTDFSTYSASKAAAYSLTQGLRDVLAKQGTAVLSVHPGPIATDMAAEAGLDGGDPPSVVAEGIISALKNGDFHLFPDTMAKQFWAPYAEFAQAVVEAE